MSELEDAIARLEIAVARLEAASAHAKRAGDDERVRQSPPGWRLASTPPSPSSARCSNGRS